MRIPLIPILVMIALCIGIDARIGRILRKRLTDSGKWAKRYWWISAAMYAGLAALLMLPRRSCDDTALRALMEGLYWFISIYVGKLIFILIDSIGLLPRLWNKPRWKSATIVGVIAGAATIGVAIWGTLINRYKLDVEEVTVEVKGLPHAFEGYRIAQISDIHLGSYGSDTAFVAKAVREIAELKPDAVMFTGDIVNRHAPEAEPFVNTLKKLTAPDGVIAILGNHDYGDYYQWDSAADKAADRKELIDIFERMGWKLLLNETTYIGRSGDTIAVIGVENIGDPPFMTYGDLSASYPTLNDSKTKILLTHNPAHWERDIANDPTKNIALTLSGHTHAMQIKAGRWSPSKWRYKYWGGLYNDRLGRHLYVNIGLGEVGIPTRIGATPEITIITLKRAP